MYRVEVAITAPTGARFALDAFDRHIGARMMIRIAAGAPITGTLVAATVSPDGAAVQLAVNASLARPPLPPGYRPMRFGPGAT